MPCTRETKHPELSAERTSEEKKEKIYDLYFNKKVSIPRICYELQKAQETVRLILDREHKRRCLEGFLKGDYTYLNEKAATALIDRVFEGDIPSCKYAIELHKRSAKGKKEPIPRSELGEVFGNEDK